jgi:hypothetical protein
MVTRMRMNSQVRHLPEPKDSRRAISRLWPLLIVFLVAGCSSRKNQFIVIPAPQPPAFLNGPMALLLTNADGLHAHVVLESGTPARQLAAGELMGKGGKLLFAPALTKEARKQPFSGGFAFLWSVPGNRGYLLSDPLQAFSPYSSALQFTNVTAGPATTHAKRETIAGHPCEPVEAIVSASDGSIAAFRLWRATDLNGLPLRIICTSTGTPLTLNLSKPRLEKLPDDLFLPPSGFTKYDSAEALANELAVRQNSLKRRPSSSMGEEPGASWDARMPTRP